MKARIELTVDIPDGYIMDGEYAEASLRQFAFDHTQHDLTNLYLQRMLRETVKAEKDSSDATTAAVIHHYENMADMFENAVIEVYKLDS